METKAELEALSTPQMARSKMLWLMADSVWLRMIVWTFVCFSVFTAATGHLCEWLSHDRYLSAHTLNSLWVLLAAAAIVKSHLVIAIAYGIMAGIILASSKRFWVWLVVGVLFVFLTAGLSVCTILASSLLQLA
jgi:hypothetical protein